MPKYEAEIYHGGVLCFREAAKQIKWLLKHIGCWISIEYKLLGASKCKKTRQQLGYYWGLLQPEIHRQHMLNGLTITATSEHLKMDGKPMSIEVRATKEDSHKIIKAYCGLVGDDGEYITLSDMDKFQAKKFVDNVIFYATKNLNMNGEALIARQPSI